MEYRPFTSYEEFIFLSRYARWRDEDNRRETWPETVTRVMNALKKEVEFRQPNPAHGSIDWDRIENAILNRDVMPSMRLMMVAGRALDQNHISVYNCAHIEIDSLQSIAECLYVLMHGTGMGFTVTQKAANKLPTIKPRRDPRGTIRFAVPDSKEGWYDSVRFHLQHLAEGQTIEIDYSKIRPEGARLHTFGGRASGPEPLRDLHVYLDAVFARAGGRKLTTEELHGIICKIASVVVVGGVRRSALISLSSLEDDAMRHAKAGEWWVENNHYALANNSAVYQSRPSREDFSVEWAAIRDSGSGERGIFNRQSAINKFKEIRRQEVDTIGVNPCGEILLRSGQFCNLTECVIRPEDSLDDIKYKIETATILGTIQSSFDRIKGLSDKWKHNTAEERLLGVSLTGIMDNRITRGDDGRLPETLQTLRGIALIVNRRVADLLGIEHSAAITTVKPSGTVSQLCGTSSGIHPAHAQRYIRRVRNDMKDPLTKLMIDQGVPHEVDFYNEKAAVFSFGIERPGSFTRDDLTAIEFLEIWKQYKIHYTDHNPSVTISIRDEEWDEVGEWVFENFDVVGGLSFLPHSDHTYQQAPYETSNELPREVPVDFSLLTFYENQDNTTDELGVACASGVCEI